MSALVPAEEDMGEQRNDESQQPSEASDDSDLESRKIVTFDEISGGRKLVVIEFNGQRYRLRLTKSGRLVLTK